METDNGDLNKEKAASIATNIDSQFGIIVENMDNVLFWKPVKAVPIPLIVAILLCGSVFFTIYHKWLNIRGFKHAIDITRGRYDNPNDPGEISHFQALTSALSATVGLGNIAGSCCCHSGRRTWCSRLDDAYWPFRHDCQIQ